MALTNMDALNKYAGYGGIGAGIAGLFGNKNPADEANRYIGQIGGATSPYHQPYINAGTNALPTLQSQYSDLLGNPGGKLNDIGGSYHESPGFKFALDQALKAANQSASAGGMLGSPAAGQEAMQTATGLANQDYYNYLQQATGLYGKGLEGEQGLARMGQESSTNMANMIAQQLAAQGKLAYEGQAQKNQNLGNAFSNLFSGAAALFL